MTTPLNNKKGTTLVELMVCLVLLALFGTAAVTLVKPCAEVRSRCSCSILGAKNRSRAHQKQNAAVANAAKITAARLPPMPKPIRTKVMLSSRRIAILSTPFML